MVYVESENVSEWHLQVASKSISQIAFSSQTTIESFGSLDIPIILLLNSEIRDTKIDVVYIRKLFGLPYSNVLNRVLPSTNVGLDSENRFYLKNNDFDFHREKSYKYIDIGVFKRMFFLQKQRNEKLLIYYQIAYIYFFNQFTGSSNTLEKRNFSIDKIVESVGLKRLWNENQTKHRGLAKRHLERSLDLLYEIGMFNENPVVNYKTGFIHVDVNEMHFKMVRKYTKPKKTIENKNQ